MVFADTLAYLCPPRCTETCRAPSTSSLLPSHLRPPNQLQCNAVRHSSNNDYTTLIPCSFSSHPTPIQLSSNSHTILISLVAYRCVQDNGEGLQATLTPCAAADVAPASQLFAYDAVTGLVRSGTDRCLTATAATEAGTTNVWARKLTGGR